MYHKRAGPCKYQRSTWASATSATREKSQTCELTPNTAPSHSSSVSPAEILTTSGSCCAAKRASHEDSHPIPMHHAHSLELSWWRNSCVLLGHQHNQLGLLGECATPDLSSFPRQRCIPTSNIVVTVKMGWPQLRAATPRCAWVRNLSHSSAAQSKLRCDSKDHVAPLGNHMTMSLTIEVVVSLECLLASLANTWRNLANSCALPANVTSCMSACRSLTHSGTSSTPSREQYSRNRPSHSGYALVSACNFSLGACTATERPSPSTATPRQWNSRTSVDVCLVLSGKNLSRVQLLFLQLGQTSPPPRLGMERNFKCGNHRLLRFDQTLPLGQEPLGHCHASLKGRVLACCEQLSNCPPQVPLGLGG